MPRNTALGMSPVHTPKESFCRAPRSSLQIANRLWEYIFQSVGEDETVEVDRVNRGTVRTAVDSGLAEVDGFGAFRLQFLVQDQNAVEPQPRVPLILILR